MTMLTGRQIREARRAMGLSSGWAALPAVLLGAQLCPQVAAARAYSTPASAECQAPQIRLTPRPPSCLLRTSGLASLAAPRTVSICAK